MSTLVNAIRSALDFVILPDCFASFLSLATPDKMQKADKAKIKISDLRKTLLFMIQVRFNRAARMVPVSFYIDRSTQRLAIPLMPRSYRNIWNPKCVLLQPSEVPDAVARVTWLPMMDPF